MEAQISAARPDASVEELTHAVRAEQIAKAEKRAADASRRVQEEQTRGLAMVFKPAEVDDDLDEGHLVAEPLDAPTKPEPSVFKPVRTRLSGETRPGTEMEEEVPVAIETPMKAVGRSRSGSGAAWGEIVICLGLAGVVIGPVGAFFGPTIGLIGAVVLLTGILVFRLSKIERRLSEILHEIRSRK